MGESKVRKWWRLRPTEDIAVATISEPFFIKLLNQLNTPETVSLKWIVKNLLQVSKLKEFRFRIFTKQRC